MYTQISENFQIIFNYRMLYLIKQSVCCNAVGLATRYGLQGPGIEFRWKRDFRTRPERSWGPSSPLYNGYRVLTVGKAAEA
jgi:hypothetical protein